MIPILLLVFAAVVCLVLAFEAPTREARLRERMARLAAAARGDADLDARGVLADDSQSAIGRVLARIGGSGGSSDAAGELRLRIRKRLVMGGYRKPSSLHVYHGGRLAFALLLPLLALSWRGFQELSFSAATAALTIAAGVGWLLPSFLLDRRVEARQGEIERGLPDALDLMVVCIEAGLGLGAAIARVAVEYQRSNRALAEEFELVSLETQAGRSNVEALRGLAERTELAEVGALVAMLIQTERFGTSVADALRVHADGMRKRRILRAEEAAAKAPIKMLFPASLLIFPATLILIAGPGIMRLLETFQAAG